MIRAKSIAAAGTLACVATLFGCAGSPEKQQAITECFFPGTQDEAPLWVCDQPLEGVEVSAVGSAQKSAAGQGFMRQMAATEARVQLAQNMQVHVTNMIKQYAETTGAADSETVDRVNSSVTKQITDQTLYGTKIVRSINAPDGTLYVLVGLDLVAAQKIAETAIKTSMNNERALWQKFQAKQGFDELAEEIARQRAEMQR